MAFLFFRLIIFFLSIYGWMAFCKDKLKVESECTPVIVFSGIGSAIFLAGILNIMNFAFGCIFAAGLFLTLSYILGNKKGERILRSGGLIVFSICLILLFCFLD